MSVCINSPSHLAWDKATNDPILVVVHPGSLCGSANYNIGKLRAEDARFQVAEEIREWAGHLLVLHGDLSDELPSFPDLNRAIEAAISARSGLNSWFGMQLEAQDPSHAEICVEALKQLGVELETPISLTGAWFDPCETYGCVNSTRNALLEAGYSNVVVLDSAVCAEEESPTSESCDRP